MTPAGSKESLIEPKVREGKATRAGGSYCLDPSWCPGRQRSPWVMVPSGQRREPGPDGSKRGLPRAAGSALKRPLLTLSPGARAPPLPWSLSARPGAPELTPARVPDSCSATSRWHSPHSGRLPVGQVEVRPQPWVQRCRPRAVAGGVQQGGEVRAVPVPRAGVAKVVSIDPWRSVQRFRG